MKIKATEIENLLKTNFDIGSTYSHSELRRFIEKHKIFAVKNVAAYSYNRWNKGMEEIFPMLEWVNRGEYKFLGNKSSFTGIVIHHPQGGIPKKIGEWDDGELKLYNGFNNFKDWKASKYEGIKIIDLNSKIIFRSKDGEITQRKILTDKKEEGVVFEEGYSLTFFTSSLGKILRFKEEGETFVFGDINYIILSVN